MLNIDMKRKINTLRDILVGRIPDPKTQVEQITLAMIYKFMDDMDSEFIDGEWDGKRRFFVKTDKMDYERFAWRNIMQPQVNGEERSALYREGIESMSRNPHIPQLFRDIFHNAFIPFRDSETINMFLKEIDDFKYDNSEDLGNAFEMLLSIMGSQGDAGQFRTPRHIIDMIIEITDPDKADSILDPACGTAGFLISSYKHILKKNIDEDGKSTLTPDERTALNQNIVGYDISPDMVRLSSVNLYLHNFPNPSIHNYDTLTSEQRWDDNFDVILANPPFMTPKGGMNPHNRFRVKAKRSEVLFVDYIAEHLNPNGRAGIIVPEGIVFQTSNAYKELRKMLIEDNYLYAIISLPAGVFNPYSGVKTSILLFDRIIAKQTGNILFVKINNDGFDLGAQRRQIKENDIPRTIEAIKKYKESILAGEAIESEGFDSEYIVLVSKKEILEKDCVLVGERFRKIVNNVNMKWKLVKLGDIAEKITKGTTPTTIGFQFELDGINFIKIESITKSGQFINEKFSHISDECNQKLMRSTLENNDILFSIAGALGRVALVSDMILPANTNQALSIIRIRHQDVINKYVSIVLRSQQIFEQFQKEKIGVAQSNLSLKNISNIKIPLPSLSVQQEIVEEIEGYQKIIDGARQVVENYKPVIKINPEWEMVELKEATTLITDGTHKTPKYIDMGVPFLRVTDITKSNDSKKFISAEEHQALIKRCNPKKGDVLYSKNGTIGVAKVIDWDWEFSIFVSLALLKPKRNILNSDYLEIFLNSDFASKQAKAHSKSGTVTNLHLVEIKQIKIPLPSLPIQEELVEEIKKEQNIISTNNQLLEIFEQKIKEKISEVWGE
jgi:type I restriction enzyme M protein